jgi:hypothetical protein
VPKLTYANVMSSLGVFLALGGTSYAVARNSIGNRELKNSAETSGKIRNGTILRKDLSRSVAHATGGSRGPRGPQGIQGVPGARGASDGYVDGGPEVALPGQANVAVTVARIDSLPAGDYVMSSQAQIGDFTNAGSIVSCDIRVNGQPVGGSSVVVGVNPGSTRAGVSSQLAAVTQNVPFTATLECRDDQSLGQPPTVANYHLAAVRVETVHGT